MKEPFFATYISCCAPWGFSRSRDGRYWWLRLTRRVFQIDWGPRA